MQVHFLKCLEDLGSERQNTANHACYRSICHLQVSADLDYRRTWKKAPDYPHYRFAAAVQYPGVAENFKGTVKPGHIDYMRNYISMSDNCCY